MHVLFCGGSPKAPSWAMRGIQIASTDPNWHAVSDPSDSEIRAADIVVVVKRFKGGLVKRIRHAGKKMVWDALDFWPQSPEISLPQDLPGAIMLARGYYDRLRPDAVICANRQMAVDFSTFAKNAGHIYHHARLDARPLPFGKVAWYDGCEKHAPQMLALAAAELKKIGWALRTGKPEGEIGALLGLRDDGQGAWLSDRWKSNVKAANALAYGRPLIARRENGYMETLGPTSLFWVATAEELRIAIALLSECRYALEPEDHEPFSLEYAAQCYRDFFGAL